jgi:hypothetical protein
MMKNLSIFCKKEWLWVYLEEDFYSLFYRNMKTIRWIAALFLLMNQVGSMVVAVREVP